MPWETQERKDRRMKLFRLSKRIEKHDQFGWPTDLMPEVNVEPMVLDVTSKSRPIFFDPYSATSLPEPTDSYLDKEWQNFDKVRDPEYDNPEYYKSREGTRNIQYFFLAYLRALTDEKLPEPRWSHTWLEGVDDLSYYYRWEYPDFGPAHIMQVTDKSAPHLKALIFNHCYSNDDELLRDELVLGTRLLRWYTKRARTKQYMFAPALFFSLVGPQHVRVIEMYYPDNMLHVRYTKLFDLRKKDEAIIKMLAQWYLGNPIQVERTKV